MKRFLIVFFVIILAVAPINAYAATNYAEGLSWERGLCAQALSTGLDVEFRGISTSFNSAFLDILPAMKKAIGNNASVTVALSAKIKAVFSEAGAESVCRPALRAHIGIKDPQAWTEQYKKTLHGDAPFFTSNSSNVMTGIGKATIPLKESWSSFTFEISATRNQIYSSMTPNWYLCFDGIKLETPIGAIFIKDLTITLKNSSNTTPAPTPRPTPTPNSTPTKNPAQIPQTLPMRTATTINSVIPTKAPTPKPSPTPVSGWKDQPLMEDMTKMVNSSVKVSVWVLAIMGIIYLLTKLWERKNKR